MARHEREAKGQRGRRNPQIILSDFRIKGRFLEHQSKCGDRLESPA